MFGFLLPVCRTKEYRMLYCDSCVHMRKNYGISSTLFLSYESVLIHALAVDMGLVDNSELVEPCRILAMPKRMKDVSETHQRIGLFSSSFTHLLLHTKAVDDIQDEKSWKAKMLTRVLDKKFQKSCDYFLELDPDFHIKMGSFFEEHRKLEELAEPSLVEYSKPTANAFGYLFSLLATISGQTKSSDFLSSIGKAVGTSIICADCGYDWIGDQKKGLHNPVKGVEGSAYAFSLSQSILREGANQAKLLFGDNSHTEKILLGVHDRLYRSIERNESYKRFLMSPEKSKAFFESPSTIAPSVACPSIVLFAVDDPVSPIAMCMGCACIYLCVAGCQDRDGKCCGDDFSYDVGYGAGSACRRGCLCK